MSKTVAAKPSDTTGNWRKARKETGKTIHAEKHREYFKATVKRPKNKHSPHT